MGASPCPVAGHYSGDLTAIPHPTVQLPASVSRIPLAHLADNWLCFATGRVPHSAGILLVLENLN